MHCRDTKLMKALRGEPVSGAPFWEMWFGMGSLAEHVLGEPVTDLAGRVRFARKMGWEYLLVSAPSRHPGSSRAEASDGTSHYVQHGKIPLDDLYARPDPDLSEAIAAAAETVQVARSEGMATIAYVPWCFHAASTSLGLEHLAYLVYDEPDYIDALFEWVEQGIRRTIRELIIPAGVDVVLFDGDCAYKNGLMVNPSMFRKLVFDRTAKTIAPLREAGVLCTFHSDGKVDDFMPILIELGFSGVHGIEKQANDLADIKRRFGREITLIGNMDVVFLTHASVAEVRAETERMLRIGCEGGRYIAACNTSPLDYIPYENYLAMVDVINHF
jgi:uroporphyrinogen decarboxylase